MNGRSDNLDVIQLTIKVGIMKFWRFSLLQKSSVLIGVSLGCLGFFWLLHYLVQGKTILESPGSIMPCLLFPYLVLTLGTGGNVRCPPEERTSPDHIYVWLIFTVYSVALSVSFYFGILPVDKGAFAMPLLFGPMLIPAAIWQQSRVAKFHATNDAG